MFEDDMHIPFATSHIIALLSTDPEINWFPSGDHDRSYTSSIWPLHSSEKKKMQNYIFRTAVK